MVNGSAHYQLHLSDWEHLEEDPVSVADSAVFALQALDAYEPGVSEQGELFVRDGVSSNLGYWGAGEESFSRFFALDETPEDLKQQEISFDSIRSAQESDPECIGIRLKLQAKDKRALKLFEDVDGVLYKVAHADDASTGGVDLMRVACPKKLRPIVMHNHHTSIYGGHVNSTAMYKEIAQTYYWPSMQQDIQQYVSNCEFCQLGKGTKPHRHGLALGHRFTEPGTHLCLDLVGPIDMDSPGGQVKNMVLVAFDPSTHFPYFIPISNKSAEEVAQHFVSHVLLEHGTVESILTDNGSEFRNQFLRELMEVLKTKHQFSPAYHPRGNMCERVNRWLGDTLRTIMQHKSLKMYDWPKMVKYLEFTYRRMPITGTDISPFMAHRGRQPRLPSALESVTGGSASAYKSIDSVAKEVTAYMLLANKLVHDTLEKHRTAAREEWNKHHIRIDFEPGELVRFWNRVPARRGETPSKLRLRNAVYKVVSMDGTRVELEDEDTGARRVAHVSQLARFHRLVEPDSVAAGGDDDDDDAAGVSSSSSTSKKATGLDSSPASTFDDSKLWARLEPGTKCIFHIKGESASLLRLGEVLESDKNDRTLSVWYYIHGVYAAVYDPERPMSQWMAIPEWYNDRNQVVPRPKKTDNLHKRTADWDSTGIHLIAAGFQLQRNKVPQPAITAVDAWLHKMSKFDRRALKVLNDKG